GPCDCNHRTEKRPLSRIPVMRAAPDGARSRRAPSAGARGVSTIVVVGGFLATAFERAVERAPIDPQFFGCFLLVARALGEDQLDVAALELAQGRAIGDDPAVGDADTAGNAERRAAAHLG